MHSNRYHVWERQCYRGRRAGMACRILVTLAFLPPSLLVIGASLRPFPSVSLPCPSTPRLPLLLPLLSSEKLAFHTLSTSTSRPLTVLFHFNCFGDVSWKGKIARRAKRPMIAEKVPYSCL